MPYKTSSKIAIEKMALRKGGLQPKLSSTQRRALIREAFEGDMHASEIKKC